MFFTKFPHRANFSFAQGFDSETGTFRAGTLKCTAEVSAFEGDVYRVRLDSARFAKTRDLSELTPPPALDGLGNLQIGENFELVVPGAVQTIPGASFGVSGQKYMFQIGVASNAQFYGMGEKNFGRLELSGLRTCFWNTDVWSDFHFGQWTEHPADPPYLSVPYVIAKQGDTYVGYLLNTSWPSFMETPGRDDQRVFVEWQLTGSCLTVGAEGGRPELWIIVGPSLRELTRKLQRLVGVTPLPPAWSLGYHQSRWEYGSEQDLLDLDAKFAEHQIPCDALWLDIDYMDGYRVFTLNKDHFPNGLASVARKLKRNHRKIVPILDPGVKNDPGYSVFDDGVKRDVFCRNPEGGIYTGLVWPGETAFPDFTLVKGQTWWAGHVRQFAKLGFDAAWIDMNDPSTGPVDPTDMLFNRGREPHEMHRNEYALGMQKATFKGFLAARPKLRPFLLSRSGFIGTARYSAVWTGDNLANYFYLKNAIPTTLNLSLSGIPFNGPDCGGFGGNPTDQLMIDWFRAGFLFPFLRNHSVKDSRKREPWNFDGSVAGILKKYIRLRYKLLPYLYNLFIDQEELGDPILRPMMYEYTTPDCEMVSDQFLVGSSILQAPILDETERTRNVLLPEGHWFDANNGEWLAAGEWRVHPKHSETPLYVKNGAVLPMAVGTVTTNKKDFRRVELHVFVNPHAPGSSEYVYRADDGETFSYRQGIRSSIRVQVAWTKDEVDLSLSPELVGYGPIESTVFVHGHGGTLTVNGQPVEGKSSKLTLTGAPLECVKVV